MNEETLAHLARADAVLAGLIRAVGPCTLAPEEEGHPFEMLARAIAHQQLNGTAANTILRRLVESCGQGVFPTPQQLLDAPVGTVRAAGFSFAKVAALKDLAAKTLAGVVPDAAALRQLSDEEIIARLTQVRGIGRWTVEMLLVFRLGRADVLPVDDFGVRSGFRAAYGLARLPHPKAIAAWGERWRPFRTTATWYLWRALELKRAGKLPAPAERIRLPRVPGRRRRAAGARTAPARRRRAPRGKLPARSARRVARLRRAAASSARPPRSGARSDSRPRRARRSRAPASRR